MYEKDLDKLYIGQKLVAYTNNDPAKKHNGAILLIGRDLSPDGSADVHCHFEAYDKILVPGTYMNAEVQIKNTGTTAIPSTAIVQYEGRQFAFLAKSTTTFEMVEVNTGETDGDYTALSIPGKRNWKNQRFVLDGAYYLLMMVKNKGL